MPNVPICPEKVARPALGTSVVFQGERLEYLPEYFVQHLFDCLPLLIQQWTKEYCGS